MTTRKKAGQVVREIRLHDALKPSKRAVKAKKARAAKKAAATDALPRPLADARRTTKLSKAVTMMRRPNGASCRELEIAFGWQPHSVRSIVSAVVRKRLGIPVTAENRGGKRGLVYKIAA